MPQMSTREPVVWGWDLAKKRDFTVGIALDENGQMCGYHGPFQKPWRETKRIIINAIGDTPTLMDSTGVGDTILEDVQNKCPDVSGYIFTQKSKQVLMEGLANVIQSEEVAFIEDIKAELDVFEYEYKNRGVSYSAPPGMHDDRVCALALAVHHFRRHGGGDEELGIY
jgi:hypothetical protein